MNENFVNGIVLIAILCFVLYLVFCFLIELINEKREPPREDWQARMIANRTGETPEQVEKRICANVENLKIAVSEILKEKELQKEREKNT